MSNKYTIEDVENFLQPEYIKFRNMLEELYSRLNDRDLMDDAEIHEVCNSIENFLDDNTIYFCEDDEQLLKIMNALAT